MAETMDAAEWQQGMIWLPAFFPHVAGVVVTVQMAKKYPEWQWALALVGLALEGISCFFIPFCTNYFVLMLPICVICFGIALIDTALLPTLGFIVDKKFTSVYGSVYAIADISYCAAYAFGPVVAGWVVENWSFLMLNIIVAVLSLIYSPAIYYLKGMNSLSFKYVEGQYEEQVMMGEPPSKEYQAYSMQEGKPVQQYEPVGQQETDINYDQQQQEQPSANPFRAAPSSNPFRS